MINENELIKNRCIKGLQHSDGLDKLLKNFRENNENEKYVIHELRRKKWAYLGEKLKSYGLLRILIATVFSIFVFMATFSFGVDFFKNIGKSVSTEKLIFGLFLLILSNIFTANMLLNELVKKKMNNPDEKKYFNLKMFKEESKTIWEAMASLVNVYKEFTYEEVKSLIEKNLSTKEYLDATRNWDKEREALYNLLEKERQKVEEIEKAKDLLYKETIDNYQQQLTPLQKRLVFLGSLVSELKNKAERYEKGILNDEDLKFIGGYTIYEFENETLVPKKNVGRKIKKNDIIDKEEHYILEMLKNEEYWSVQEGKLAFLFFKRDLPLVMEIEVEEHHREFVEQKNQVMINFLYDVIGICLDII